MQAMAARQEIVRPDGAVWYEYGLDCGEALLTQKGNELLTEKPEVQSDLYAYVQLALGNMTIERAGVRTFFEADSNSRIYTLNSSKYGNDLLVKETNGSSMRESLYRLDKVKEIIDKYRDYGRFPDWIDVPMHYGLIVGNDLPSQFVLMEGIDNGINVRDVVNFGSLNAKERLGVTAILGNVTAEMQEEVRRGYQQSGEILNDVIAEDTWHPPHDLLSDWHEGNVVLEQLVEPIDGNNFRYWVIDQ